MCARTRACACVHVCAYAFTDTKHQLPAEHARFRSIDNDFIALMRTIAKKPKLMDVLALPGTHIRVHIDETK